MKLRYLYFLIVLVISSCGTEKFTTSNVYEDDIYYNPSLKPLTVQEMERKIPVNNTETQLNKEKNKDYISTAKKIIEKDRINYPDVTQRELDNLAIKSVTIEENPQTGLTDTIIEVMNKGFWINGFKGTQSDLEDAMRTIERFPLGFGYFSNGAEIGQSLAYDSDWNVFTRDGRYWWFPTFSNINLYSRSSHGTYPRYNEIVMWNNPNYDYWDFDYHYNVNLGWNSYHYYRPFSSFYWGYNTYWFNTYDPFYYGMFPYSYGFYHPYNYRYFPYYHNYSYRSNKRARLIRERGYRYGRSSRDRRTYYNNKKTDYRYRRDVINRRNFGDPSAVERYKDRKTNYKRSNKRNTNYKRKTVRYKNPRNSTRPSYNSNSSDNNTRYRNSNSNRGNNSSSNGSNRTRNSRVRRR